MPSFADPTTPCLGVRVFVVALVNGVFGKTSCHSRTDQDKTKDQASNENPFERVVSHHFFICESKGHKVSALSIATHRSSQKEEMLVDLAHPFSWLQQIL